jgi:acetyltransferase
MRPAPVTAQAAEAMLAEVPPLDAELRGFRRSPAGDRCTLADVVARASLLAAGLGPRLAELDLNPVVVGPEGGSVVVVDARIILEASGALPGLER